MVTNKPKKVTKYRGHTTHGGGHRKKRRGAGSRGGRGKAGSGKRAGHKKFGIVLGTHGFRPRRDSKEDKTINVGYFTDKRLEQWLENGKVIKEGDTFIINLTKLGYQKLLGTGKIAIKLKINVSKYSNSAEEKVKAAGGNINSSEENTAQAT